MWFASYITIAMLDDIYKGFLLFAMQISSKMAKISLSFEYPMGLAAYQVCVVPRLRAIFINNDIYLG